MKLRVFRGQVPGFFVFGAVSFGQLEPIRGRAHSRVFRGRQCRVRLRISVHSRELAVRFGGEEGLDMAVELLDLGGERVVGSFLAEERQELADGIVD